MDAEFNGVFTFSKHRQSRSKKPRNKVSTVSTASTINSHVTERLMLTDDITHTTEFKNLDFTTEFRATEALVK